MNFKDTWTVGRKVGASAESLSYKCIITRTYKYQLWPPPTELNAPTGFCLDAAALRPWKFSLKNCSRNWISWIHQHPAGVLFLAPCRGKVQHWRSCFSLYLFHQLLRTTCVSPSLVKCFTLFSSHLLTLSLCHFTLGRKCNPELVWACEPWSPSSPEKHQRRTFWLESDPTQLSK